MSKYLIKAILPFFVVMTLGNMLYGQKKFTETEIKIQELFIEANKEKILGHYTEAIQLYEEILNEDEANHTAAYELARVYILNSDFSKGLEWAQKAVKLSSSKNIWYLRFLAKIYEENAQFYPAATTFESIIKLEPEVEENYFIMATYLLKANRLDDAIDIYNDAEDQFGISERLVRLKSTIYQSTGKIKKAEKEWLKLVESYPENTDYLSLFASFYEQNNQKEAAAKLFERILKLDPENVKAKMALAGQSTVVSDELSYLESLKPIFRQADAPLNSKIKQILPAINKIADNGPNEATLAEKVLELTSILEEVHEQQALGFAASGDLLYSLQDFKAAKSKYKAALKRNEAVFSVWEQLMRVDLKLFDYKSLYEITYEAIDIFPNQPIIYFNNGLAAYQLRKYDEALSILDQAELMSEGDQNLYLKIKLQRAFCNEALGYKDAADKIIQDLQKRFPENPEVLANYAYLLAERTERLNDALTMVKQAIQKKDEPNYRHIQGWVLYKKGEFKQALKNIEPLVNAALANDPVVLDHYGDTLFQLEDKDNAYKFWQKAKDMGNTSPLLEKKITDKKLYE